MIQCCGPFTFIYCNMTLHDDRSGFNQMLLDLRFCMRLQDDTADCEGGGGFNQMFLELCFSVMLMMRRGGSNQMLLGPCFSVTLNDEREGFQSNAHGRMTLHEKRGG